jgi:HK97 family phage major capsid protein
LPYSNVITRSEVQALIPEEVSTQVIENMVYSSAAMALFNQTTMSRNQQRMPVLAALPIAYFVSGDTGLKQTTEMMWANKYFFAEEIAAIVPIPEAVLDDSGFDVWGLVRPRIEEAIGRVLDAAIFFGTNKPASWPVDVSTAASAAGNTYNRGTATVVQGGVAEDLNQAMALVEQDGFVPSGIVTRTTYRARLRSARDNLGQKLLDVKSGAPQSEGGTSGGAFSNDSLDGLPVAYTMPGLWPTPGTGAVEAIVGDWDQGLLATRQDITYKILDQAVIQDNTGAIMYNLAQQDMVALRVVARFAWQVPNPISYENQTESTRYPFCVLKSP